MRAFIIAFLKIFFRNPRVIFFVVFLPAGIFIILAYLGIEQIIRFNLPVSYANFLLAGIVAMSLMQTGIYTVAYTLIDYRRTHILKRLSVTPLSAGKFLLAQIISRFLIACAQVAVILLLGFVFFHTTTQGLWYLPFLVFVGSTIFLNLGFLIASVARDYEEAAPYTTLTGLSLIFLGDVFFPVENLPRALQHVANYLPLKPLANTIRHFLLGTQSPDLLRDILVMMAWFLILTIISQYVFRKRVYR